jgi:hypothetical protein
MVSTAQVVHRNLQLQLIAFWHDSEAIYRRRRTRIGREERVRSGVRERGRLVGPCITIMKSENEVDSVLACESNRLMRRTALVVGGKPACQVVEDVGAQPAPEHTATGGPNGIGSGFGRLALQHGT